MVTKNNIFKRVKGLLPLFFLLAFSACKKESSDIGASLRDDKGGINTNKVSFTNISTRTVEGDTFRVDNLNANILGTINDPLFGTRKASLVVQPLLDAVGETFDGKTADSIFLVLRYDAVQLIGNTEHSLVYGDTNSVIELEVYKLDQDLPMLDADGSDTSKYYNTFKPQLGDKVGTYIGTFDVLTQNTLIVDGDTTITAPELIIPLDQSFGQELMELGTEAYSGNDEFRKALKGLVVVPKTLPLSGEGAIVGVETSVSASGILLHYGDSLVKAYPMSSSSKTINYQETEHSATLTAQINGSGDFSKTYIQSLDGTKIFVEVPELKDIIEMNEVIVINEAKISFKVDQSEVTSEYGVPSRAWLQVPDTSDGVLGTRSVAIIDLFDDLIPPSGWNGFTNYGGDYQDGGYEFRFNRYLQSLVKEYNETGNNSFNGFYLSIPPDFPAVPTRAVINSDVSSSDIKVSVTYTKLN